MAEPFTATAWSRSVGQYTLACKVVLTDDGCTIWVEDNDGQLEQCVCENLTEALHQTEAWFEDYRTLFYRQLVACRDRALKS